MSLFFLAALLSLIIIGVRRWVHFEIDDFSYDGTIKGGLFSMENFEWPNEDFDVDVYGWDCLAVGPCDQDDDTTICKTFEPLMDAGRLYLQIELANLIFLW